MQVTDWPDGRRAALGLLGTEVARESPVLSEHPDLAAAHLHNILAFEGPLRAARERMRASAATAARGRPWLRVTNAPNPGPSRSALKGRLAARQTARLSWRPTAGSDLLAATQGSAVHVWDVRRRAAVAVLGGRDAYVIGVDWSPDGSRIASLDDAGVLLIHEAASWQVEARVGLDSVGRCVGWHRDGEVLAVGCDDGAIRVLNPEGTVVQTLRGHEGPVWVCDWNPAAHVLASGGEDNTVRLWAPGSTEPIAGGKQHDDAVTAIAWHPAGSALVSGGMDYRIVTWAPDLSDGGRLPPAADGVLALAFSPDGEWLASAGMACSVTLERTSGEPAKVTLWGHAERVSGLAWSPDSGTLASCSNSQDEPVSLWDVPLALGQSASQGGHLNPILGAAFSRDARMVATTDHGMTLSDTLAADKIGWPKTGTGRVCVWDARDGTLLDSLEAGYRMGFVVDWAPDGSVAYSDFTRPCVWRRESGGTVARSDEHDNLVTALACHPTDNVVASGSGDGTVRLWAFDRDAASFTSVASGSERVLAVAWSPDGAALAMAGVDGIVHIYSSDLQDFFGEHTIGPKSVHSLEWSPDGRALAWADTSDTLAVLDLGSGRVRSTGGVGPTKRVAFSPDGSLLATGTHDGRVAVWDARSLRPLATERAIPEVGALRFSADETLWCSDVGGTAGTFPLVLGFRLESAERSGATSVHAPAAPAEVATAPAGACTHCGAPISPDDPWCPSCGRDPQETD